MLLVPLTGVAADDARLWHNAGGTTTLWFNRGAIGPLGIAIARTGGDLGRGDVGGDYLELRYAIADGSGLSFRQARGVFSRLEAGAATHRGGPVLRVRDVEIDLAGFRVERRGAGRVGLVLADRHGTAWFRLDHAQHHVEKDALSIRHLDLRIAPALAAKLGRPEWAGIVVGGAAIDAAHASPALSASPEKAQAAVCSAIWPSPVARPDVRMIRLAENWEERQPDGVNAYRCGRADGAGGHTLPCTQGSLDGLVVLSPDASLRNEGNASVAWHPKFSPPSPPYDNDQHPYLVWNLYRRDADGSMRQIAASGVKHAFHTINAACGCEGGQILYPGCEDTYGGFSNDFPLALGPRAEVIPYTGEWARCGSVFDADCDGRADDGGSSADPYDPTRRMVVREAQIAASQHPGARWFLEYGYVVRDDADPYNTTAVFEIVPRKEPGQGADPNAWIWRFDATSFANGTLVEAWASGRGDDVGTALDRFETAHGRGALGTRVVDLGNGRWRYDYLLFNLDFTVAQTQGSGATLRMLASRGFGAVSLPVAANVPVDAIASSLYDPAGERGWTGARVAGRLDFTAGTAPTLDWGRSLRLSFESPRPPLRTRVVVYDATGNAVATPFALVPTDPPGVRRRIPR
ncbi:hypothetical protein [Tahibacter soli]|uniref:Uncharacterized protein n=1 Tax=Tahibacter soli TaxID=2983605 RepID=A0A9X3YH29_9GAMM|nr:hypothetical protein [Tahibacter soli]MDC8012219.1 hypothetical protein [Tahibacter soli]